MFDASRLAEIGQSLVESSYIAVVVWDEEGSICEANAAFWDLIGRTPPGPNATPLRLPDLTPDKYHPLDQRAAAAVQKNGIFSPYEKCLVHERGHAVPIWIAGAALADGTVGFILDLTERKLTEETLQHSEEQFRKLARHVPGVVYLCDYPTPSYRFINEAVEQLTGIPARRFYDGRATLAELRHPEDAQRVQQQIEPALAQRRTFELVYRLRHANGTWRWVEENGQGVYDGDELRFVEGVILDVTARKEAEDALKAAHGELEHRVEQRTHELKESNERLLEEQAFLRRTLDQHERHRQVIAYEIHDGLAQYLTAALMQLEACDQGSDAQLEIGLELLRKSLDEARRLISGLRPPILDESGLVAAIEYLIGEQGDLAEGIEFVHDVRFERLPPLWEINLFRIVQEALTNVAKHSKANAAEVELRQTGRSLSLRVTDLGQGFDPAESSDQTHGLQGIRRRARLLGGTATINSRPGKGSEVVVESELPEDELSDL